MADEKIRKGDPDNVKKKKAPPPDEEDEKPRKKKRVADDDEGSDIGSSPLSAVIPVGGSIFALASLWLSVLSLLMSIAGFVFFAESKNILLIVLPAPWMLAFLCGVVSFFTAKHKASYGSITGNMRAILGILISLGVMVLHGIAAFVFFK